MLQNKAWPNTAFIDMEKGKQDSKYTYPHQTGREVKARHWVTVILLSSIHWNKYRQTWWIIKYEENWIILTWGAME